MVIFWGTIKYFYY